MASIQLWDVPNGTPSATISFSLQDFEALKPHASWKLFSETVCPLIQGNLCLWIVVLEKTLESPLDCMEIKPVNPKENQSWLLTGRTDAEAEAPILWPADKKNWLTGKDPDAGGDWGQEEKGTTEDEIVGWHHQLNRPEFEQAPGVGDGQGSLACHSPWGHKESDTTEWLKWLTRETRPTLPPQCLCWEDACIPTRHTEQIRVIYPQPLNKCFEYDWKV